MAKCEVCGNDYYRSFEVITASLPELSGFRMKDALLTEFRGQALLLP